MTILYFGTPCFAQQDSAILGFIKVILYVA